MTLTLLIYDLAHGNIIHDLEDEPLWFVTIDIACVCLMVFDVTIQMQAHRNTYWRSAMNVFDFIVVSLCVFTIPIYFYLPDSDFILTIVLLLRFAAQLLRIVMVYKHHENRSAYMETTREDVVDFTGFSGHDEIESAQGRIDDESFNAKQAQQYNNHINNNPNPYHNNQKNNYHSILHNNKRNRHQVQTLSGGGGSSINIRNHTQTRHMGKNKNEKNENNNTSSALLDTDSANDMSSLVGVQTRNSIVSHVSARYGVSHDSGNKQAHNDIMDHFNHDLLNTADEILDSQPSMRSKTRDRRSFSDSF
jgi:hypothetical protein